MLNLRKAKARQPEILRSVQKDAIYAKELSGDLSDALRLTGARNWIKYNQLCDIVSAISYHGFSALNNLQTLGEEYTGIIQITADYKRIPTRVLQLATLVLEFAGDALYMKLLQCTQRHLETNNEISQDAKQKLLYIVRCMRAAPPYIKSLHKSWFYLTADKYQISKRCTGINYVLVRHWLQPNFSLYGYKILGFITFLQVTLSFTIDNWFAWREQQRKAALSHSKSFNNYAAAKHISNTNCVLCLEPCRDISLTPCGHLFCWNCILDWLDERDECPLCREALQKSRVICLQNYD